MTRRFTTPFVSLLALSLALGGCRDEIAAPSPALDPGQPLLQGAHPGQGGQHAAPEATLAQQLAAVREVTKRYRDIGQALEDGFLPLSPYVPEMGFHFTDRLPPFGTDPLDPPVLVYFTNGSYDPAPGEELDPAHMDDLVLGAVEWLVPGDQTDDPPNLFADEGSPRALETTEEHGWHYETDLDFTGLHAWVHRGNAAGVFHSTNPTIE